MNKENNKNIAVFGFEARLVSDSEGALVEVDEGTQKQMMEGYKATLSVSQAVMLHRGVPAERVVEEIRKGRDAIVHRTRGVRRPRLIRCNSETLAWISSLTETKSQVRLNHYLGALLGVSFEVSEVLEDFVFEISAYASHCVRPTK